MLFRSLLRYAGYGQQTASRRRPARQRPRARLAVEALEDRTLPSTFVVDRLTDTGAGEGLAGDLRYCLGQANANPGDDAITFSVKGTINLTGALPSLSSNIDLEGPGASSLTVRRDTGGSYRIFTVDSGATVILSGLTISNGYVASNLGGGGIANVGTLTLNRATVSGNTVNESGGGIANFGTLTLNNSTVSGNFATDSGGGIYNGVSVYDTVTLNNSTVSGNFATGGGGIRNVGGTVTLTNTTISGNDAYVGGRDVYGGGIYNSGALTLNNATVIGNYSYAVGAWDAGGGGIYNSGTLKLNNGTVSGNYADGEVGDLFTGHASGGGILNNIGGTVALNNATVSLNRAVGGYSAFGGSGEAYGGGIDNSGTLTLNNATVAGNSTDGAYGFAGGIYNRGTLTTRNTILAGNSAYLAPDLVGDLGSLGHNLLGNTLGGGGFAPTDLLNVKPLLGPLQDNGGPTKTMALLGGSPALNAGDPAQLGVADQRDVLRSGGVNIGAYQASASTFVVTAPATVTAGTPFDLAVRAVDALGQTAAGYLGTVHLSSADGQAVLPGDYHFTLGDGGLHFFIFNIGVTLKTAGPQTVTATDTGAGSITGSTSVTVNPAAADHLLFFQQPTDTPARQTINPGVTVAVVDQFGNVVTSDDSDIVTLTIGANPSGGTLSGTLTVTVSGGIATFSDLSIDLAGNGYTLHATTTGLTNADSVAFSITA